MTKENIQPPEEMTLREKAQAEIAERGQRYFQQPSKNSPPPTSGRYGQKTQYFQNVFRNNPNLSPQAKWEEEKTPVRSLRDEDETWETQPKENNNKTSTSIISQRKATLGEKSPLRGQKSPGRAAANLNDSSSSISKAKQVKSGTGIKARNGKNPSDQIPTKRFDLSGTQTKKVSKSQLQEKRSPNTSQIREQPYQPNLEVLKLPSNSDREGSKLDQTRSEKQFSERSDSDIPKTEGEQDFQQPLEATLDLSAYVIPRTGNNTNKAADVKDNSGFGDFFGDNPFHMQKKKSSEESEGAAGNRSQSGRQGGEDLNKSSASSRGDGGKMAQRNNNQGKMFIDKENIEGGQKRRALDLSEASLDQIDDQELLSEVREKLWSLSNKIQGALNAKHSPLHNQNEMMSSKNPLSPINQNIMEQRKASREEQEEPAKNLKFFPYQNDYLFYDEQARSPASRRTKLT